MFEVSDDILNRCESMAKMRFKSAFELDTSYGVKIAGAMIPRDGDLAKLIKPVLLKQDILYK